ncbi:MAG: hypothetical protein IJR14_06940 [Synergistaceae bacterium]|nr:hypothetical protein [Synergistaceae bacterium]
MKAHRNMDGFDGVPPFGDGLYDTRGIASHLDISLVHLYTKYVYSPRSAFPRGQRQSGKLGRPLVWTGAALNAWLDGWEREKAKAELARTAGFQRGICARGQRKFSGPAIAAWIRERERSVQ